MRKILLILLCCLTCFVASGCVTGPKRKRIEAQILELQESLLEKDQQIRRLQEVLKDKERMLSEKNAKIEQLRKKLESLGVFE